MPDGKFDTAFRLPTFFAGDYGVIFFYPLNFNYISWTELLSVQKRIAQFAKLNASVVAISCDSHLAHQMWQVTPPNRDGLGALGFPMIADMTRHVARKFDVLVAEAMPEAATLIVDRDNKVIFQLRHDTAVGRNIDRLLEAVRMFQTPGHEPTAPVEQIMLVEKNAARLQAMGYVIVAQSADTTLDHPQWKMLPRTADGKPQLSFSLLDCHEPLPHHDRMTIVVREGLNFHSTGLLMPDGQLLFEHHADRQIPRDFSELLRIADATKYHREVREVVPWETPQPYQAAGARL
jgi:peroxiredoxin (alkyl hydroperoxide reductase subunit C)